MSEDTWTVVNRTTSKRKVAKQRYFYGTSLTRPTTTSTIMKDPVVEVDPQEVTAQINACSQHLLRSHFYDNAIQAWESYTRTLADNNDSDENDDQEVAAAATTTVQEIVCYGIGNFIVSKSSHWHGPLWQLAFALQLPAIVKKNFNPNHATCPMVYYDPLVTNLERTVLQQYFQINVLSNNEKGKRCTSKNNNNQQVSDSETSSSSATTTATTTTLFFMPHCPKGLYENVLWANWNQLQQNPLSICIIGNSLVTYVERAIMSTTTSSGNNSSCHPASSCLELIQPFLREQLIVYSKNDVRDMPGQFEAAFNDTYLTWFVKGRTNCNHHDPANKVPHDDEGRTINRLVWPERPEQPSHDGQTEVL